MNEKDQLMSKVIDKYDDLKNKEINSLNTRINELQIKVEKELEKFDEFRKTRARLKVEQENADMTINSLLGIAKSRGIIFDIHNKNFKVKEWEHLKIEKINNLYSLINKNKESLYILNQKYNDVITYIISNYSYSIIVIRIDSYSIKVQLRIVG